MTLIRSIDLLGLPSDRTVGKFTPAGRLIRKLAEDCWMYGPHGVGTHADTCRRELERMKAEPVDHFRHKMLQPGFFIMRCSDEEREVLRALTSKDVEEVGLNPYWDESWYNKYKFGPAIEVYETPRTMWKIPGSDRSRWP